MDFLSRFYFNYRRIIKTIQIYLLLAGPGLIVMIADNDAGGITTYAATGAKFGYNLIWFLILLGPVAYFVQEMTVRLGAVTKHGHAEAIFSAFGSFWGWFSLLDLSLVNWLTLVTEFIGMTAGLSIFGIPPMLTVIIVVAIMMAIVVSGRYWTWEKITMVLCLVNLIYIPAAFLVHPSVDQVIHNGFIPNFPGGFNGELFFFLMANIGTTIAPWMIFFQQSAVVDKQMKEKDIPWGKFDTVVGAFFTVLVAVFIIIVTGTLLHGMDVESAAQAAAIMMTTHPWVGTLLAIGLFDAGFLGALCIALTSSWAFGEVFGWAHSLNYKVKEAIWFYLFYFFALVTAGSVVLIPGAPLMLITLFVQVVAVTLLPAALVFLIILLNNGDIMGKYKNTLFDNIANITIVTCIIVVSSLYGISTLFPNLFG
ncbi:MAG: NRAMP family divalent metal transporter [Methanoregula sp.]|uniref:NRAMP family divalent metal transporter n=1 Tax=Methanoregula sp. TaxID=2052170 RepID=UPI003BB0D6AB